MFVHESVHDEFVDKLTNLAASRRLGNPLAQDTDQGPQVDQAQFDKIMSYIEKGNQEGANCRTAALAAVIAVTLCSPQSLAM